MFTARKKISKDKGQEPDSFEESVAQVHTVADSMNATDLGGSQESALFSSKAVVLNSACVAPHWRSADYRPVHSLCSSSHACTLQSANW